MYETINRQVHLKLSVPHPAQQAILASPARFRIAVCGRRFGKTEVGKRAILTEAIKGKTCWWLTPTYPMAEHTWRDLKATLRGATGVKILHSQRRIEFCNGGSIEIHSAFHPDNLRGAGLDFVVLDEAAYMKSEVWTEVIRPMLVESRGAALFLSSPNGRNWFYDLYCRGVSSPTSDSLPETLPPFDSAAAKPASNITPLAAENLTSLGALYPAPSAPPHIPPSPFQLALLKSHASPPSFPPSSTQDLGLDACDYASFHFPTAANPHISAEELESIRRETSQRIWEIEYLAFFTDSLTQVFRGIREAATAPLNPVPNPADPYVIGIDWARTFDFTTAVVMNGRTKEVVAVDRFTNVTWTLQCGRLKALSDRWHPRVIYAEENSFGSPNIEALQREGFPVRSFYTTSGSKSDLIESLALAVERRHIALQPHEALLNELAAYRLERLPSGAYRYSAPPGQHDDLVIALALSYYASQRTGLPILSA